MASNNIARLGVVLGLDSGEFQKGVDAAIAANVKLKRQIEKDVKNAAADIEKLKYATEDYGKSVSQVERIQREMIAGGRYANATQDLKNKLLEQAAAYDKKVAAENKAYISGSKLFQMTTQQRAALAYQTTDIITGLASGQNPLIVLIQQGGQLRDQFGGFIPLFRGIAQMFNLVKVAVGGLGIGLAGLAFAAYRGGEEFKEFRNSLALTNNLAGLTHSSFRTLNNEVASRLKVSLSDARDILIELTQSGKFTNLTMGSVAEAIGNVAKLSGQAASVVAKDLIPSFNGSAASVATLNEKYNFLTFAQYKQIEALERAGKKQEAIKLTADLLNSTLNKQREILEINEGWWAKTTRTMSDFFEKLKQYGAPETEEEKLKRLADRIQELSEISILGLFKLNPKAYGGLRDQATKDYLNFYQELLDKRTQAEKAAQKQQAENDRINSYKAVGGEEKRQQILAETRKIYADKDFQERVANANEFQRIELESQKKQQEAANEFYRQNELTKNHFKEELLQQYLAKVDAIEAEAAQKRLELSRQEARTIFEQQETQLSALRAEEEKLQLYKDNIFLSETQLEIALSRLRTEQEIEKILRNEKLTEEAKTAAMERAREIQNRRESVLALSDDLKMLQDVNKSVFNNMEQAIENFVRTGKLSFKDFARSIIQDILAIYMKAQLLQMFNMGRSLFSNFFGGGFGTGSSYGNVDYGMYFADGGDPPVNRPAIVGERGPELFIPRTAGTIIPNDKLGSAMGGNNYITNNYINAIDTKSFEERLLGSSNAIWAANQYANKSLAVGRGRA